MIALGLNRSASALSQELSRNGWVRAKVGHGPGRPRIAGSYRAVAAQERATICTVTPHVERRLRPQAPLWGRVVRYLKNGYSPEQIAGDARGGFRGAAPALLGMTRGDDAVPGIGSRALSEIRPEERTTPAGRFVASLDRNLKGEEILWVDYETAVSMHRVVRGKPDERSAQRLAFATPLDNRISFGCINIPVKFYENVVSPLFAGEQRYCVRVARNSAPQGSFRLLRGRSTGAGPGPVPVPVQI